MKHKKYIDLCKKMACSIEKKSQRERMAAAILDKNGRLVSTGINKMSKTDPKTIGWYEWPYVHAEFDAIIRTAGVKKGTAVVVRVDAYGNPVLSTPCSSCLNLLHHFGIRKVVYINSQSKPEVMKLY